MTVMVTGASGPLGHALVPMMAARDEVRAAVRRPEVAEPLRALGAKVTVGRLDDADALAEVMSGCFSVIHLVGGSHHPDHDAVLAANHRSTTVALAAAREAGVKRFLHVSVAGASVDEADPYLRAKGLAEEAVEASGLDHAIVRPTHLYGLGGLWFTAQVQAALHDPPLVLGDPVRTIAPSFVDDLAAVLAAADDRPTPLGGTWGLEGPDVMRADALIRGLADGAAPSPVPPDVLGSTLEALLGFPVSAHLAGLFASGDRADAPDAAAEFGVALTPLDEGLDTTLRRAAGSVEATPHPTGSIAPWVSSRVSRSTRGSASCAWTAHRPTRSTCRWGSSCRMRSARPPNATTSAPSSCGGVRKIFAAGADIKAMAEWGPDEVAPSVDALGDACDLLESIPKISIAAVNGYALGGGLELAMGADLRYLADDAQVGQPEIRLGVIPGAGGTQRLARLAGIGRARELVYSGRNVGAEEALRLGIAERVAAPADVFDAAVADARGLAAGPRQALAAAKGALRAATRSDGDEGMAEERARFLALFGSHDQREGMRAFLDKRDPSF